jgi:hypothetical protein
MLMGPLRFRAYSSPIFALPHSVLAMVFSVHVLHLEHRADLQVVLQVGAHARQVAHHVNAVLAQQRRRADARQLQDLRRANAARAQDHFTLCGGRGHFTAGPHLRAGAPAAAIGLRFNDQFGDLGRSPHFKVGPAVAGGPQEGLGRVPAPAVLLVDLEVAHAFVVAAVEVLAVRYAGLLRGLGKCVQDVPAQALAFHAPFAARAVQGVGTLVVVFVALESGRQLSQAQLASPVSCAHWS